MRSSYRIRQGSIYCLLLFLGGFTTNVLAQQQGVSGRVMDSTVTRPVAGAKVLLVGKGVQTDTLSAVTDTSGLFVFERIPSTAYRLLVVTTGYKIFSKDFFKPSAGVSAIDVGDLILSASYKMMEEVVIEAPPVTMKEDTIEYRASAFPTKPNASTEDLLKKLPGIQVDRNGNITAQGKQVTRIKVNGKDFFSGDPKTASRELPADLIDKVQVVDDYGDQAAISGIRDGESEKIINLELRKDKNKGWFGRGNAAVGTKERYQTGVNANYFNNKKQISFIGNSNNINQSSFSSGDANGFGARFNGASIPGMEEAGRGGSMRGMGAAFSNLVNANTGQSQDGISRIHSVGTNIRNDFGKRNSLYGSYVYTGRSTEINQFSSQENLVTTPSFTNKTNQQTVNRQGTHRAFLNTEIWLDSFNYIKITPNISLQESRNLLTNGFDILRSSSLKASQQGSNRDTSLSLRPSFRTGFLYNHRFRKRGRNFSLNADIGWNQNELEQTRFNQTSFFRPDGTTEALLNQQQLIRQDNRSSFWNIRMVYSEPITKDRFLDLSYNGNRNFSGNERKTYDYYFTGGFYLLQPALSNAFETNFDFNRFGASIRTVKKKYNYTIGLQAQPVLLKGYSISKDSSYQPIKNLNWFPVARLTYNFSRSKSFTFNYNGSAQQPSFNQLQPVRDITNPQAQTEGNPRLQPSVSHTFTSSYNQFQLSSGRILFASLTVSLFRDQIVNNVIAIKDFSGQATGAQLSRPENVNGAWNMNAFYTYSRPWNNRKYVLTFLGTLNFNRQVNLFDSVRNTGRNWLVLQGVNFDFNPADYLELSAGLRYNLNYAQYSLPGFLSQSQESWVFSSDVRADLPKNWIFRLDVDYTLNRGLAQGVGTNIALLNMSLEKELLQKKNATLRLQVFDLLNQNLNVSRNVSANFITDSRVDRLSRYFMISFQYRLNRFRAQQQMQKNQRNGWMFRQ